MIWEGSAIGRVVSTVAALLKLLRISLNWLEALFAGVATLWKGVLL